MKTILTSIAMSSMLVACAVAQTRYTVTDLGPLGPGGQPFAIKNNGLISGAAAAKDGTDHAVLWYKGWKADFGTPGLGGPNSEAFGINEAGQAVGDADTSATDPNGEDFCGFKALGLPGSGASCLPFIWQYGVITPLPTLGGNNGAANQINNRGQIVGEAETTTVDAGCPAPQKLQFKPVLWQNGMIQALPTIDGDLDGVAFAINDNGQAVGASGNCSTFSPQLLVDLQPLHALLWQNGTVTDLGSLGGTGHFQGNVALGLNNLGQGVGNSDLPGDMGNHAFLWTAATGMKDLGTLPGDVISAGIAINDSGEVVGVSLDADFNLRAYHWQNGIMNDLNALVPADTPLALMLACSINAQGQIVGLAVQKGTQELHGYVATPINDNSCDASFTPQSRGASISIALPEALRKLLQREERTGVNIKGRR